VTEIAKSYAPPSPRRPWTTTRRITPVSWSTRAAAGFQPQNELASPQCWLIWLQNRASYVAAGRGLEAKKRCNGLCHGCCGGRLGSELCLAKHAIKHIHFVGGRPVRPASLVVLCNLGYTISGSDLSPTARSPKRLASLGIMTFVSTPPERTWTG
jgi:hypothetical protein